MIDKKYFEAKANGAEFPYPVICDKYESCFECKDEDCNEDIDYRKHSIRSELCKNTKK